MSADVGWEAVATTLVAERGDALTRYAMLISGRPDDAADLVQDALIKTFSRLGRSFTVQGAEAYVRRAILTTHLDGGRRRTRFGRIAHLAAEPAAIESSASSTDDRIDLFARLARLAPRERACVVLRYYEDLTVDKIAIELGISSGAVKRYLSDALHKLAIELSDEAPIAHRPPDASPSGTRTTKATNTTKTANTTKTTDGRGA